MEKRGFGNTAQISIFVILAIAIIAAGGLAYYSVSKNKNGSLYFSQPEVKPQIDKIKSSISDCMNEVSDDSLELIGIQGGYYKRNEYISDMKGTFVPYYYYDKDLMPSKETVEKELAGYVDANLMDCLEKIKISDFSIKYKKPKTKALIEKGSVLFSVDSSAVVAREANRITFQLDDFPISHNSKLFEILEVAREIIDFTKENNKMICISCIDKMASEKNLFVDIIDMGDDLKLFLISENTNSGVYVFEFLNKYEPSLEEEAPADL